MFNIIKQGDYEITVSNYSTGSSITYDIHRNGIYLRSGGAYTETEALADANEWIKIDKKSRGELA